MKFERCHIHCLSHVYCPLAYVLPREVDPGNVSRLRSAWPALDRYGGLRQAFSHTSSSTGCQKSTLMSARNSASCRTTRETDRAWSERHSEVVNSCRDEFQVATLVTTARKQLGELLRGVAIRRRKVPCAHRASKSASVSESSPSSSLSAP